MSENTKIVQCFLSPMVAGKYTVEVEQNVVHKEQSIQNINKTFCFGVDAARFTLKPNDIYSVYPPANKSGNYSETLPHIVFSRRTLPWERTIDGKPYTFQEEGNASQDFKPVPWMALLLFNEEEMTGVKIKSSTIADILQPEASDKITRPEIHNKTTQEQNVLKLMEWEQPEDGCYTIDITKKQFEKHIPSKDSLSYLAHAKEVDILNKDKEGIEDINEEEGKGIFSVMVGNSLPTHNKNHTAILVSLEGYANYLEGADPQKTIPNNNKVRLVVLANWNFDNSGEATFSELINKIEVKSMQVKTAKKVEELAPYFQAGYTAMEHITREGVKTVSWYRGPFVPKLLPAMSKSITFSSADSALRYDKTTGFFDVSISAAWQLGRTLGLQNQEFSKAMLNWRITEKQEEVEKKQKEEVSDIVGNNKAIPLKNKVINYLGELHNVEIETPERELVVKAESTSKIPKEVKNFLNSLYKLKGVPFSYLVPHEFYLKKDDENSGTLSLFYVDPNWVEALLDGALSIGRVSNIDNVLDRVMRGEFLDDYVPQTIETPEETDDNIEGRRLNTTGFLLRSDLVSGWRGVEIKAYNEAGKLLPAYRFERIDSDIFLGIFNGNVASIEIKQPYEGLHFGIKENHDETPNMHYKSLKDDEGMKMHVMGMEALEVREEFDDGLIKEGVVDISGLANTMKQKIVNKRGMIMGMHESTGKKPVFTSAEFAYQMIDSPIKHTIKIKN